jgi:hypothetical protein
MNTHTHTHTHTHIHTYVVKISYFIVSDHFPQEFILISRVVEGIDLNMYSLALVASI